MAVFSGLNSKTGKHLQLDAGILVFNVRIDDIDTASPNWNAIIQEGGLGATKGGTTFTATPEFRSLLDGVNGSRGNYKNGQVIDSWDISLKTTVSEMTANNIRLALGETISDVGGKGKLKRHKASVGLVKDAAYSSSVAWFGKMHGETEPMVIFLKDVLNVNGVNFVAADKDTGTIELELKAHFDVSKPDEVPFAIFTYENGGDS